MGDGWDNCPLYPNGAILGTCLKRQSAEVIFVSLLSCVRDADCGSPNLICDNNQLDGNGNGIGDVCQCEFDFDCDYDVDGTDAVTFKGDFGRSSILRPCTAAAPCNGDFDCDHDCDGSDAFIFKKDFGRSSILNPCPPCPTVPWCAYP